MPLKNCNICTHASRYKSEATGQIIIICCVDGWEDNEDGTFSLTEVSNFDESECPVFREQD